jgi:hypothetical protein
LRWATTRSTRRSSSTSWRRSGRALLLDEQLAVNAINRGTSQSPRCAASSMHRRPPRCRDPPRGFDGRGPAAIDDHVAGCASRCGRVQPHDVALAADADRVGTPHPHSRCSLRSTRDR